MTCADIMYQSRSSCFAYPHRSSVAPEAAFSFLQAAKKFGAPKMHEPLESSNAAADYSSSSPTVTPSAGSVAAAANKDIIVSKTDPGVATDAQYISANCVLFTYYSGDISSVVDEHFSRALSQPSSYSANDAKGNAKDTSPMSQRNFPPSFWNSNYQSSSSSSSMGGLAHAELSYSSDPYHALHGLHHQGDPWHYSLSTQTSYSHRQMHDLAAYSSMPGTSRFNPQYSSLLLQPSVRPPRLPPVAGQCNPLGKADAWATPRYHESLGVGADLAHLDTNYSGSHTYTGMSDMPGLDSSVQGAAKDLYWF